MAPISVAVMPIALRQFVQHARFGERERRVETAFAQHAELLGVEAVEAAHRGDAILLSADMLDSRSTNWLTESSNQRGAAARTPSNAMRPARRIRSSSVFLAVRCPPMRVVVRARDQQALVGARAHQPHATVRRPPAGWLRNAARTGPPVLLLDEALDGVIQPGSGTVPARRNSSHGVRRRAGRFREALAERGR